MAKASLVISIIGVCIAIGSYFRGGQQWRRSGPELGFNLSLTGYRHPGTNVVHRVVARIEVFAEGRMAVHLRSAELRGPGSTWVMTEIASGGAVKLEPTEAVLSDGIPFDVPEANVRAMLSQEVPNDPIANEIIRTVVYPAELVRGRVRRDDGKAYTKPRKTLWEFKDEPWPALPAGFEPASHRKHRHAPQAEH